MANEARKSRASLLFAVIAVWAGAAVALAIGFAGSGIDRVLAFVAAAMLGAGGVIMALGYRRLFDGGTSR